MGSLTWIMLNEKAYPSDHLVYLSAMLSDDDPLSAKEQLHIGYLNYGGWRPMKGFTLEGKYLCYPNDPPIAPIALTMIRDEAIIVYPGDWVVILQTDDTFEVCRMD